MNAADPEKNLPPLSDLPPESTDSETEEIPFPASVTEVDPRIAQLESDLAQAKDQMLRALAEAENTRRRAVKEREDAGKYAVSSFARDLLSVADNFTRALAAISPAMTTGNEQLAAVVEGIEATGRELERAFEKQGIHKVTPGENAVFDPNLHEVMFEVPGTGKPPGTVMQVVETGYVIHDRLLRPARVGVAKDDGSHQRPSSSSGHALDTEV
ncbi:MAG: nucleotide exchange factor GrpE [Alphaproteobacteria bacterium]|nr:nucleotide exchange factor GrpE [Alphaproteobacteria bacterium]